MPFPRIPETIAMRPIKWAVLATHAVRDRLPAVLDTIMERLEAYETEQEQEPTTASAKSRTEATGRRARSKERRQGA